MEELEHYHAICDVTSSKLETVIVFGNYKSFDEYHQWTFEIDLSNLQLPRFFFNSLNVLINYFVCSIVQINACLNIKLKLYSCGAGTVDPSGVHEFTTVLSGIDVSRSFVFCVMFYRSLFVLLLLVIVLSVLLRFMASDYLLGIFKLFLFFNQYFIIVGFLILLLHCIVTKLEWPISSS